MRRNHVLAAWRANRQTIGGWLSIDSAYTAEVMANAGFDWLCLDMQHGMLDYNDLKKMLPAISTTDTIPLVRVPWNEPYQIMKALDAGAYGIIVPLVNNRAEAERAVSACKYPPQGIRSFGPIRGAIYGGAGYAKEANTEIACVVMIETAEALNNLDDILSTPGVDAAYIGPADLAYALDVPHTGGDNNDALHVETVNRIASACKKHGVAVGIHTSSLEFSKRFLNQGFHMVTLGGDSGFMARLARQELREARGDTSIKKIESGFY
jgi:4-hydroxy-2-oxoheptanedioate aldolase